MQAEEYILGYRIDKPHCRRAVCGVQGFEAIKRRTAVGRAKIAPPFFIFFIVLTLFDVSRQIGVQSEASFFCPIGTPNWTIR